MKKIEINKGGFGLASFFEKESTKNVLVEQRIQKYHNNLNSLDELGIEFKQGDEFYIKSPAKIGMGAYEIYKVKVYNITDEKYECEFMKIDFDELARLTGL